MGFSNSPDKTDEARLQTGQAASIMRGFNYTRLAWGRGLAAFVLLLAIAAIFLNLPQPVQAFAGETQVAGASSAQVQAGGEATLANLAPASKDATASATEGVAQPNAAAASATEGVAQPANTAASASSAAVQPASAAALPTGTAAAFPTTFTRSLDPLQTLAAGTSQQAQDLTLYELNGQQTTLLGTYANTYRVVIGGRASCSNTEEEVKECLNLAGLKGCKDVQFIVVDVDNDYQAFSEKYAQYATDQVHFASADSQGQAGNYHSWCAASATACGLNINGYITLPYTILLDQNNNLVAATLGPQSVSELLQDYLGLNASTGLAVSSVTGVDLGSGYTVHVDREIDQVAVYEQALATVVKWRQDALDDESVKYGGVTMREYLAQHNISEQEYLSPQWSNSLERIALQRAVEAQAVWSHTRPNGESCFSVDYGDSGSWGEVLAWGASTIEGSIDLWASEKGEYLKEVQGQDHSETGHYTMLIDPTNSQYGFGMCGTTAAGETGGGSDTSPTNLKGNYTFEFNVTAEDLASCGFLFSETLYLTVGQSQTISVLVSSLGEDYYLKGSWVSSNQDIASFSGNTVQAVGAGKVVASFEEQYSGLTTDITLYSVGRLAGDDRYATMGHIVDEGFSGGANGVAILVTGANFPDALAASALAGLYDAPVLLTQTEALSQQAKDQINRLGISTVYVLGGVNSVSDAVLAELQSMQVNVQRIAGESRQSTSVKVFEALEAAGSSSSTVIVAAGGSFPDTLSVSPYAYAKNAPIILADGDGQLTAEALDAIKANANIHNVVIVGGTASVSDAVQQQLGAAYQYERLSGDNRYETSAAIAKWELDQGMSCEMVSFATGKNFPDALAGAAFSGVKGGLLLLIDEEATSAAIGVLSQNTSAVSQLYVYGGTNSVNPEAVASCVAALYPTE